MLLAVAALAACTSSDIVARIANTNSGAGHAQTTIALVNQSKHPCMLKAFPQLTFVHYSERERVAVSRTSGGRDLTLAPDRSAALSFIWSRLGIGAAQCGQIADVLVTLPGGGLPLFVPVHVGACLAIAQSPLGTPAPAETIVPDGDNVVAANDRWFETQDCQQRLLHLTLFPDRNKPRTSDSLSVDVSRGTNLNSSAHTGQGVNQPSEIYDPGRAIFVSGGFSHGVSETTLCSQIHTIPYGIVRATLPAIKTKRGVALGMNPKQVESIDGTATLIPFDKHFAAIRYQWKRGSEHFDLNFLFDDSRLMAIDYTDSPQ